MRQTQAQTWKSFLNEADSRELFDRLLDEAFNECVAGGDSSRADYWMIFPDLSEMHVFDFDNNRRGEQ